jgi:HK97 family phage prohead protease
VTRRAAFEVAEFKSLPTGQVTALVSVFDVVDHMNDRVVRGAFEKNIREWKLSGDPIPVIYSHNWSNPFAHIGVVRDLRETDRGLLVEYDLDVDDNPVAAQVHKLMKRRSLREHSFGYDVVRERKSRDGTNELLEVKVIEVGPTLKGANPNTELLAVKSEVTATPRFAIRHEDLDDDDVILLQRELRELLRADDVRRRVAEHGRIARDLAAAEGRAALAARQARLAATEAERRARFLKRTSLSVLGDDMVSNPRYEAARMDELRQRAVRDRERRDAFESADAATSDPLVWSPGS